MLKMHLLLGCLMLCFVLSSSAPANGFNDCDLIIINHHYPYENLNGAVNRFVDVVLAATHLGYRVHLVYEHFDQFADDHLERWTHPSVNMIRIPADGQSDNTKALEDAFKNSDFKCAAPKRPVAFSFPWAWRESFIPIQIELHKYLKDQYNAAVIEVLDDNPFLYYLQDTLGFDKEYNERMLQMSETIFFDDAMFGFVGISDEVTQSLVTTPQDIERYSKYESPKALGTFPFTYTINDIEHHSRHASYEDSYVDYLLMGDYHAANIVALEWLCKNLMPKMGPFEQFHIMGKLGMQAECKDPRVVNHNFVSEKELEEIIFHTKVFVAPIMVHTGVSTKVAKALSFGTPVVATPDAYAGIKDNMEICGKRKPVIVTDIEHFAEHALDLHNNQDKWETMQKTALPCSLLTFSRTHLEKSMSQVIDDAQEN